MLRPITKTRIEVQHGKEHSSRSIPSRRIGWVSLSRRPSIGRIIEQGPDTCQIGRSIACAEIALVDDSREFTIGDDHVQRV